MYLEVLIDTQKPVLYVLNKPEIYIGSQSNNDIVISSNGISRKHLKILIQDEICFVIDQGSTNGSYLEEEKISPGKRIELKMSETLRLGEHVFLKLLSEKIEASSPLKVKSSADGIAATDHEKTRVISLKALEVAKKKQFEKKRKESLVIKKKESQRKKAEKDSFRIVTIIASMLIVGGILLHFGWQYFSKKYSHSLVPQKGIAKEIVFEGIDDEEEFIIPSDELIPRSEILTIFGNNKCLVPDENYFCEKIPALKKEPGGVFKTDAGTILFVDERKWARSAQELWNQRVKIEKIKDDYIDPKFLSQISFLSFVKNSMAGLLDSRHQQTNFYIVLFTTDEDRPRINTIMVIKGPLIPVIVNTFTQQGVTRAKSFETFVLSFDKFYKIY